MGVMICTLPGFNWPCYFQHTANLASFLKILCNCKDPQEPSRSDREPVSFVTMECSDYNLLLKNFGKCSSVLPVHCGPFLAAHLCPVVYIHQPCFCIRFCCSSGVSDATIISR